MKPASRGFRHFRRAPAGEEGRVPPGQYVTQDFPALPAETITADIHCVTRWSKLDTRWPGRVAFDYGGQPLESEPSVVTIGLEPPDWPGHRAGQHLDVRLTAEDGYTAEREYSIASAPGEPLAITVQRLEDRDWGS